MTTWTVHELAQCKGTSEPARQMMLSMNDRINELEVQVTDQAAEIERLTNALWKATGDDEDMVNAYLDAVTDCTPNHLCQGRMIHLPIGEQCDKCGETP